MECYHALYRHFTAYADFVSAKQDKIEEQLAIVDIASANFKDAKGIMDKAKGELNIYRKLTFENYDAMSRQLRLFEEIDNN